MIQVETRTNEGDPEVSGTQVEEPLNLEHVLDAWRSKTTGKRFDVLRLERKDGESLEVLVDHETARDLGDRLTITAARLRYRTRGPSPIVEPGTPEAAGDDEDRARARKVFALLDLNPDESGLRWADIEPLVDEFRALREDRAKAFAMVDDAQKLTAQRDQQIAAQAKEIVELRAELVARSQ